MKKDSWYIIVNPAAANGQAGKQWPAIARLLTSEKIVFSEQFTERPHQATTLVAEAIASGFRKIMAIGGDGTNNEVINGIFQQQLIPASEIIYTLIPLGTGNDWIKTHGIPNDFRQWIPRLSTAPIVSQDVGVMSYYLNNKKEERYFANVAGLAYDGYLCKQMSEQKTVTSAFGFWWLTVRELFKYQLRRAKIISHERTMEDYFYTINIGICKYSGGGMQFVPHAVFDDGLLAVTTAGKLSKLDVVLNSWRFYNGSIHKHPKVNGFQTKRITIQTVGATPTDVEVDGEYLGHTPVECWILERALKVVVGVR